MFENVKAFLMCPVSKEITKENQVKALLDAGYVPILYIPRANVSPDNPSLKIVPSLTGIILAGC